MHIRSSPAYFQKVTHNVLAMPTQFLTTVATQCLYVYCITIWHKSKMWSQSHLRKRSTQLALLPRQDWVHPYTNSNAIVKHFHGHSLASSPYILGKEGPKKSNSQKAFQLDVRHNCAIFANKARFEE